MANATTKLTNKISYYESIKDTVSAGEMPLDLFFEDIRKGRWEDIVTSVRIIANKEERDTLKKQIMPIVTIAGTFTKRNDQGVKDKSGFIAMDIDNVDDIEELKSLLCPDKYVVAAFQSVSGRGLCVLFNINPEKHRESFQGLSEYLFEHYRIICDPTSINPSRARFVSFDADIFVNENFDKFTRYPKEKERTKFDKVVYAQDDFDNILTQIRERSIDITGNYQQWLKIGFALSHKFGEQGRDYFHMISTPCGKYSYPDADRQYTACMKARGTKVATIASLYYYCKEAGIGIYSPKTKLIAHSARHGKKDGLKAEQVADNLRKFGDVDVTVEDVQEAMNQNVDLDDEDTLVAQLEIWLKQNFALRRNKITRYIEIDGLSMESEQFNDIYIRAKKIFDKLTFELLDRLIRSSFTPTYDPFIDFFDKYAQQYPHERCQGTIKEYWACLESEQPADYIEYFCTKWLAGIVASIHGYHSVLMPVLCSKRQNTGKSQLWRRLLPKELHDERGDQRRPSYYAESKLDAGKDDFILMTQKLIIVDDEMGGKSKKESKLLKDITSKPSFDLREPYGRNNVRLRRLASLAGTTNDDALLSDFSGNRRIVPIKVTKIDYAAMNKIDRVALLMEAYWLYKSEGYSHELNDDDIKRLGQYTQDFEVSDLEVELIQKYFEPGEDYQWSASEIKIFMDSAAGQRLTLDRIGKALSRLGFKQKNVYLKGGSYKRAWFVKKVDQSVSNVLNVDDTPF